MKSNIYGALSMLVATMVLAVPALNAQSRLVADVPFGFYVGDKAMPAGDYEIRSNSDSAAVLQNLDTAKATFLLKAIRIQDQHEQSPKLVFERCGNQYFLAQIWDGASDTGIQLPRSKREKQSLVAVNGVTGNPEVVVLAMNRN
jgi:hypothetical protein